MRVLASILLLGRRERGEKEEATGFRPFGRGEEENREWRGIVPIASVCVGGSLE